MNYVNGIDHTLKGILDSDVRKIYELLSAVAEPTCLATLGESCTADEFNRIGRNESDHLSQFCSDALVQFKSATEEQYIAAKKQVGVQ